MGPSIHKLFIAETQLQWAISYLNVYATITAVGHLNSIRVIGELQVTTVSQPTMVDAMLLTNKISPVRLNEGDIWETSNIGQSDSRHT